MRLTFKPDVLAWSGEAQRLDKLNLEVIRVEQFKPRFLRTSRLALLNEKYAICIHKDKEIAIPVSYLSDGNLIDF